MRRADGSKQEADGRRRGNFGLRIVNCGILVQRAKREAGNVRTRLQSFLAYGTQRAESQPNENLIMRTRAKNVYSPSRSSFFNVSLDYCATVEEVGPHQRRSLIIIFESGSPSISMGSKSSSSSSQRGGISLMSPFSRSRFSTLASSSSSEGFSSTGLCSSNHSSNSFCSAAAADDRRQEAGGRRQPREFRIANFGLRIFRAKS